MAAKIGSIYLSLTSDVTPAIGRLNYASGAISRFGTRANRDLALVDARMNRLGRTASAVAAGITRGAATLGIGLGGALAIGNLRKFADTWTQVQNQLKVAGLEGDGLKTTLSQLFAIAQRQGAAIEPLVTLYGRLASVQAELGASSQDLTRFTEGVALALRVQGGDAQSAAGALLQLSQALGGGKVQAEEYNSLIDGARPLLQAVAAGLEEAGGSVAKLTQLVKGGEVSSEAFFRAFLAGLPLLEKQAESTATTTGQAMTRISNSLALLVGEFDRAAGTSQEFARILGLVAGGLDTAAGAADPFVARLKSINDQIDFLKQLGPIALFRGIAQAISGELPTALLGPWEGGFGPNATGSNRRPGGPISRPSMVAAPPVDPVSLQDFSLPGDDGTAAAKGRERIDVWQRETAAIIARTEALRLEAEVLGLSTFEVERARIAHELLTAAQAEGVEVTPELESQIDALASSYAEAAVTLEQMADAQNRATEAMQEVRDIGRDVLGGFIADLRAGESAADGLASALNRVLDRLLDIALNSLFGSGPGFGGLLSGLFGGNAAAPTIGGLYHSGGRVGTPARRRPVHPSVFTGAQRFHAGGIAGLSADEVPAILQRGEIVLSRQMADRLSVSPAVAAMAAGGGGGGPPEIHIHEAPGTKTSVGQRQDGSLDIVIEQKINDAMGRSVQERKGGAASFERAYGLNRTAGLKRQRKG